MKAVILAGGFGTRLRPVTLETPKPLLTVKRKPILNHLLELFSRHAINEPILLIHKDHQEDFKWWRKRYENNLPPKLRIAVEPEPLGTFGGLKELMPDLQETFILSNGDELKDFHLTNLIKTHRENKNQPVGTIALVAVPNPSDYGVPVLDPTLTEGKYGASGLIREFLEKPKDPPSKFISSGLYVLEPEVFNYADWSKGYLMIEKDIFPKLAAVGKLAGYKVEGGRWFDCGTFERWEQAIKEW